MSTTESGTISGEQQNVSAGAIEGTTCICQEPLSMDRISFGAFFTPIVRRLFNRTAAKKVFRAYWHIILLLPAVPCGFAINYSSQNAIITFLVNLVALFPLGGILSMLTEEFIARRGGDGALMIIISLGNIGQLIIAIISLVKQEYDVLQYSIVGGVISNIVLLVGISIFIGGRCRVEQHFNQAHVRSLTSLLILGISALVIPLAFQARADGSQNQKDAQLDALYRGTSVLVLLSCICLVLHSFKSHKYLVTGAQLETEKGLPASPIQRGSLPDQERRQLPSLDTEAGNRKLNLNKTLFESTARRSRTSLARECSQRTLVIAAVIVITFLGFHTTFATDLDGLMAAFQNKDINVPRAFIGLIAFPIVGCNLQVVTFARRDELPHSFAISIGSSAQLLTFVLPVTILIAFVIGDEAVRLSLDGFQITSLWISQISLMFATVRGKTYWLQGVSLIILYFIFALAVFLYPLDEPNVNL